MAASSAVAGGRIGAGAPSAAGSASAHRSALFAVVLLAAVLHRRGGRVRPASGATTAGLPRSGHPVRRASRSAASVAAGRPRSSHRGRGSRGAAVRRLAAYEDTALGFSLEYDPANWEVAQQDAGFVLLSRGQRRASRSSSRAVRPARCRPGRLFEAAVTCSQDDCSGSRR